MVSVLNTAGDSPQVQQEALMEHSHWHLVQMPITVLGETVTFRKEVRSQSGSSGLSRQIIGTVGCRKAARLALVSSNAVYPVQQES